LLEERRRGLPLLESDLDRVFLVGTKLSASAAHSDVTLAGGDYPVADCDGIEDADAIRISDTVNRTDTGSASAMSHAGRHCDDASAFNRVAFSVDDSDCSCSHYDFAFFTTATTAAAMTLKLEDDTGCATIFNSCFSAGATEIASHGRNHVATGRDVLEYENAVFTTFGPRHIGALAATLLHPHYHNDCAGNAILIGVDHCAIDRSYCISGLDKAQGHYSGQDGQDDCELLHCFHLLVCGFLRFSCTCFGHTICKPRANYSISISD
jgi:hypothetical protein